MVVGMKKSNSFPEKVDRKVIERNRRIVMKDLCIKLTSLIPTHHFKPSKDMLSLLDQLDQTTSYISQLKGKIKKLEERRAQLAEGIPGNSGTSFSDGSTSGFGMPVFEIRDLGSSLEVVLISGLKKNFMLHEVISILQDEGAEVVTVSLSTVGNVVFHTLHAQVKFSRVGVKISSVSQRLQKLIY